MKIAVVGLGYVGLANALALVRHNEVVAYDIDEARIKNLAKGVSPLKERGIEEALVRDYKKIDFVCSLDDGEIEEMDFVIVSTPTDYDTEKAYFNTESIDKTIETIRAINRVALIVIKSTIPVGYTEELRKKFETDKIIFSPEFLREGKALEDVLRPSRIIVGDKTENGEKVAKLLMSGTEEKNSKVLLMNSSEAEAVKLFANTYLAIRVAFFNELDTYAVKKGLSTKDIIDGVSTDSRIGDFYNNPSFGYGGYCLPKDTKQLVANYADVPNELITAVVRSNKTRKNFIINEIIARKPSVVGVYRLAMKAGSDNFRNSSILDIVAGLKDQQIETIIYEPGLNTDKLDGCEIATDLMDFKRRSSLIVANRLDDDLMDAQGKVYTRDIYGQE